MTRAKEVHQATSENVLCELILLESERNELLAAYEHRRRQPPYPVMALQIFAHNVREHAAVAVYLAHAPDLLKFAHGASLGWLEQKIVDAWRARRDQKGNRGEGAGASEDITASTDATGIGIPFRHSPFTSPHSPETKEATPGC